jgi:hypothetical protein
MNSAIQLMTFNDLLAFMDSAIKVVLNLDEAKSKVA